MAGYSSTPLIKKLGIKEGSRVGIINPPPGFDQELGKLPDGVKLYVGTLARPLDLIISFVVDEQRLLKTFPALARKLTPNGMLWITWPKKSANVPTDLSFNNVQRIGLDAGLVDVKICAVNEVWSGLKFVYRLKDRKPAK